MELKLPVIDGPDPDESLAPVLNAILVFDELVKSKIDAPAGHDIQDQPRVGRRNILGF